MDKKEKALNLAKLWNRLAYGLATVLFGNAAGDWLYPIVKKFFPAIQLLLCLSLVSAAIGLCPPYLTKLIIDDGIVAKDVDALLYWAGVLFLMGLVSVLLGALNGLIHLHYSAHMLGEVRLRTLTAIFQLPPSQHQNHRMGEYMTRLDADAGEVQQFAFNALLSGAGSVFRLIGGACMLFVLDWRLALIAIGLSPIEFIFLKWARPYTEKITDRVRTQRGLLSSFLAESIMGLVPIKMLGAELTRSHALSPLQNKHINALIAQRKWQEFSSAIPTVLSAISRSGVLLLGGYWVIQNSWPIGSLIAFLAYMGFLMGPLRTLLGLYHAQAKVKVAVQRLMDIVETDNLEDLSIPKLEKKGPVSLSVKNLSFSYVEDKLPLFDNLSFDIKAGEKVHLDAPSGRGKTTLINLLAHNLTGYTGEIQVAPYDYNILSPLDVRRIVRVVPQFGYFFNGSIEDNLRLAGPEIRKQELIKVLEIVCLKDMLFNEKEGLDTQLSEHGRQFSGGQRQRLSIARSLLVPFGVLVLDESLSEVDTKTATQIMSNIDLHYGETIRIVVAHAGSEHLGPFSQTIQLASRDTSQEEARIAFGVEPNQRENARENAV